MVNALEEEFEEVELFGKPALFTNGRIDRDTVPDGWYCYDLLGSDYDPGRPVAVEPYVIVNHAGSILTREPVKFDARYPSWWSIATLRATRAIAETALAAPISILCSERKSRLRSPRAKSA